jgi:hypothetical protein
VNVSQLRLRSEKFDNDDDNNNNNNNKCKSKGKVHHRTDNEGPAGSRVIAALFL